MPKLIDYPRTTYAGAWELAEVTDDTGGKCAIETAARKLNRKVSGSFKAIIGSAVKFGLLTSKRDLLTTTTLFKRIKHAYDKQEELLFHREAFLTPPLFTQLCRKFRSRELPIQMLDVMLIREFGVEEINAQGVAKGFVEGCRMVGLLDERNIIADIDALAVKQPPRREIASPQPPVNTFRHEQSHENEISNRDTSASTYHFNSTNDSDLGGANHSSAALPVANQPTVRPATVPIAKPESHDAISSLFGLMNNSQPLPANDPLLELPTQARTNEQVETPAQLQGAHNQSIDSPAPILLTTSTMYQVQVSGPGVNTSLSITDEADVNIVIAMLEKIRRQLKV